MTAARARAAALGVVERVERDRVLARSARGCARPSRGSSPPRWCRCMRLRAAASSSSDDRLGAKRDRAHLAALRRRRCRAPPRSPARRSRCGRAAGSTTRPRRMLSVPTKEATKRGARAVVDLERRADLLDPAVVHHHDAVGHRQRLFLVVRHVDRGDAELALDARGSPRAARRGSWRRAPRAARRAAGPAA